MMMMSRSMALSLLIHSFHPTSAFQLPFYTSRHISTSFIHKSRRTSPISSRTLLQMTNTDSDSSTATKTVVDEDPYIYLEEVESERSLNFAKDANQKCLDALGDPKQSPTFEKVLSVLESDERIPYVSKV